MTRLWPVPAAVRALLTAALAGMLIFTPASSKDQGIGGTGARVAVGNDQGIGGTGIYGTITGFGSIIVNATHIAYDAQTPVFVDGVRASTDALKVGGVVNVVANARSRAIRVEVVHEVIGIVEQVDILGRTFTVAGQTVYVDPSSAKPGYGQRVAVSGLRRPDGVIVANLIEALDADGATRSGRYSRTRR